MVFYKVLYKSIFPAMLVLVLYSCGTGPEVKQTTEAEKPDQIVELKAKIDDLNNKIFVLTEQVESLKARLLEGKAPVVAPVAKPLEKEPQRTDEEDLVYREYSSAYRLYQSKEYSKALVAFFAFVEKYPDSVLTDNAYLWIGESYYQQGEYQLAIDEYKKLLQKFPLGSRAPQAMLKAGISYKMLGDQNSADQYFNGLISKYPNSKASEEAVRIRSK